MYDLSKIESNVVAVSNSNAMVMGAANGISPVQKNQTQHKNWITATVDTGSYEFLTSSRDKTVSLWKLGRNDVLNYYTGVEKEILTLDWSFLFHFSNFHFF